MSRTLRRFPDPAHGCFNGRNGRQKERWCFLGFLSGDRENPKKLGLLCPHGSVVTPSCVWALSAHGDSAAVAAMWSWADIGHGLWEAVGVCRKGLFLFFFSEGIWYYSVESSLQVEFLGSSAVVCLHLKIWPFIWKQTWASSSSFIQAVLFQGQGVRPAQLNAAASS